MAKPQQAEPTRPAPRLYLVTPPIGEADGFAGELGRAIAAADVAAVLLRLKPAGERELINIAKSLASVVQPGGVALMLDGHAEIAALAGADGAHLAGIEAFLASVESLKPARMAGCGGLATRHDAMLAAERGADYVMFGETGPDGRRPAFETIIERIEWWSGLFEIPCVGFAEALAEVGPLAAAGADFVAIGGGIWADPRGVAVAVAEAAGALAATEPAA